MGRARLAGASLAACVAAGALVRLVGACSSFASNASIADAGAGEAGVQETSTAKDGGTAVHDLRSPELWSTFDLQSLDVRARNYVGAVFDGRYLYLVPNFVAGAAHGYAARYDTQSPFDDRAAWTFFDLTTLNAAARGYAGGVYVNGGIYYVPQFNGVPSGFAARVHKDGQFGQKESWSTFDVGADGGARGFWGGTHDNKTYLYFSPIQESRRIARNDFTDPAGFTNASRWSFFDVSTVDAKAYDFIGSVFDGSYVYFPPASDRGVMARHDTRNPTAFTDKGSWVTFDLKKVDARAGGFTGAVFDGRFIYLAPYYIPNGQAIAARYDTTLPFETTAAWAVFDPTTIDKNARLFRGAVFDGTHVYFVPNDPTSAVVTRYDTTQSFGDPAAWSTFDLVTKNPNAKNFFGGAFDGRYVYLIPSGGGVVARFLAKDKAAIPATASASFL
jgi:hypothetical protein